MDLFPKRLKNDAKVSHIILKNEFEKSKVSIRQKLIQCPELEGNY